MNPKRNRTPALFGLALLLLSATGCGAGPSPAAPPPCDQACQDGVALLGVRTAMKIAYNFAVATQPVGAQDKTAPCVSFDGASGGTVHVFGMAKVDAVQGASIVNLKYDFQDCLYSAPPDPTADQNFSLTMTGEVSEDGTISVQPTATTALSIASDSLSISGTVYDPPNDYAVSACALSAIQNGNSVSGALCGRAAGFMF